jgi:hypothetical protein
MRKGRATASCSIINWELDCEAEAPLLDLNLDCIAYTYVEQQLDVRTSIFHNFWKWRILRYTCYIIGVTINSCMHSTQKLFVNSIEIKEEFNNISIPLIDSLIVIQNSDSLSISVYGGR